MERIPFLVLWIIFSLQRITVTGIPLGSFYSFGVGAGDSSLGPNDDGSSPTITLSESFPFFDEDHSTIFVNNNGDISFTTSVSGFTPSPFPLSGNLELIAPYWADVDTRGTGNVWYRQTVDSALLNRARDDIRAAFTALDFFTPSSLFIATWDHVGYYNSHTDKTNTFQCVMATDGTHSFVIFLYANGLIQWTTGDASGGSGGLGGTPAQVGFNAGDGVRFAIVPGSRTASIINIASTSNVGINGVWIYRVDAAEIVDPNDEVPDPPTNIQATSVGTTMATVTWTAPGNIDQSDLLSNTIQCTESQFGLSDSSNSIDGSATSYTVSGLEEYNAYTCRVAAVSGVGSSELSASVTFTTEESAPSSAPMDLVVMPQNSTSISLSWSPPLSIHQNGIIREYRISIREEESGDVLSFTSSLASRTVTSLHPHYTYHCRVSAYTVGDGPLTNESAAMTFEAAPSSPPEGLTVVPLSSTSISLSWAPPLLIHQNGIIREYRISITEVESGDVTSLTSSSTSRTVTALHPYYTYQCTVSAFTVGLGPSTSESTVRTFEDAPSGAPQNPEGIPGDIRQILLAWEPPLPEDRNGVITGYIVNISSLDNEEMLQLMPTSNSITVSSLSAFTVYVCTIAATTSVGSGPFSDEIAVQTLAEVPGPPTDLQVTSYGATMVSITWLAPDTINPNLLLLYIIVLTDEQFGLPDVTINVTNTTTSYTLTELEEYNTYTCNVAAVNEMGVGEYSSINFTTQESAPTDSPTNLTAIALDSTSIFLSWFPPPPIHQNGIVREYRITITEVDTGTILEVVSTITSATVLSLHPYYSYNCVVSAYTVGAGPYTEVVSVRTLEEAPNGAPQNYTGEANSSRSAVLTWEPPLVEDQNGIIIGYVINVTVVETGEIFQLFSTTNTLTVNTLSPYTTYICIIAARTSIGLGPFSTTFTVQTPEDVPTSPPQNQAGNASSSESILLSWDPPPPREQNGIIRQYGIIITEVETGTNFEVNSTSNFVTISSLHPFYTYEWVVSCYTVGVGPYTTTSTVTTLEDVPTSPPQQLAGTAPNSTSLYIFWNPPPFEDQNGIIREYRINMTEVDTGSELHLFSSATSITVPSLHPYYAYQCRVAAFTIGIGPYSATFTLRTLEDIPTGPPENPTGTAPNSTTVFLSWDPPPRQDQNGIIREYKINITEVETGRKWQAVSTTTSIYVPLLHPYYVYEWSVSASTIGDGPYTSLSMVMTPEDAPSAAPENITIAGITSRSISLSWDPPHPEDQNGIIRQYIISINEIITSNTFTILSTTTSVLIENLHPFYSYMISLAAETTEVGPFGIMISVDLPEDAPDAPPRNVNGIASSATAISLNWDPPLVEDQNGVIREYLINVTENETGNSFQLSVIDTTVTLSSLHPAYTYECRVSAVTTDAGPFSPAVTITTIETAPNAPPQSFTATQISSQSVDLMWDPPLPDAQNGVIIGYIINVTVLETGEMFQLFSDTNSLGLNFLRPFTTYICVIAAQTAVGVGPYSITYQVTTLEDVPSEPESVLVMTVQGSPSQLQVFWDPPNQPNGLILSYNVYCYEITINDGSGSGSGSENQILHPVDANDALQLMVFPGNVTEATVSGLIPYTQYNCYVTANTSVGEGNVIVVQSARTDESTPDGSPENFQVSDVNSTAVNLTWSDPLIPNGIVTTFTVTYNFSNIVQSITLSADIRNVLISGLEEYTIYVFAISASTRIGSGPSTEILLRTEESSPHSPPEHVQSIVTSSKSVIISWEPPAFVDQNGPIVYYILVIREQQFNLSDIVLNVTGRTNYTLSSLEEYNTYSYQVAAASRVGVGPYSDPILFTTLQDVPSAPPQDLSGIAQSSTLLTFIWSPPPSIDINGIIQYYMVMVSEQETGRFWNFFAVEEDINLASLHPFFNYECQVAAFTIGSGPYTSSVIVQTDEAAPSGPPTNIGATAVLSESLSLSWNPPVFEDINGIIRSYIINVTELETGRVFALRSNTTQATLTNLHPFYTYACAIAAETVDVGPYTINLVVQLSEGAPTAPPADLFGYAADSTTIILSWSPPPFESQNGIIRRYVIGVTELDTGTNFTQMSLTTQTNIGSLHPFYTYQFTVTAVTVAPGPPSSFTIQTEQDAPSEPPQSVSIAEITSASVTLMWDAPETEQQNGIITGYVINVTMVETGERFQSFSTSSTLILDALRPFTSYICAIAAQTIAGVGPFSTTVSVRTEEGAPDSSPEDLTATSLTSTSISISWSPPQLNSQNGIIREYRINITEVQTGSVFVFTTSATSIIVPSLHPYYDYRCTVSAYTVDVGPYSEVFVITTPEDVPSGYPQNFNAVATSSRSATLMWDPPLAEEQNGVIISYVVNVTAIETAEMFQLFSETNSILVATLSPFTTYSCFISASTSIGNGPFSTIITLRTPEDVPTSPPINPTGIAESSRSITFSWDPPPPREQNGIIREYRVNVTEVDTGRIWQFISTMTSLTVTTLHPFYTYKWIVSAYTIGIGPHTDVSTVSTPEDVPDSAPRNLSGEPLSSRDIFLTWESPPPENWNGIITGYLINITKLVTGETQHFVSTSTNLTISSLSPFTLYACIIAATTNVGSGPFTEVIRVQTLEEGPSSHPLNTTGISLNSTHIQLEWDAPPPSQHGGVIREYRINVTEFETERVFYFTSELTEIIIGPLHPFYTYICAIAAFTVDLGPFSDNVVVITDEDVPSGPPRNLQAVVTDSRSIFISWEPPLPEEQNGILRQYVITLMSAETDDIVTTSAIGTNMTVSGLIPFTTYQCRVAAETIATGPRTEAVLARTSEDIPTAPPQDLQLNTTDTRTLVLTWEPVATQHTNGLIRRYSVKLTESETGIMLQFLVNDTMFIVSDLHPFYIYSCSVAAETIGLGPFTAEQSIQLPEDAPASSPVNVVANNIGATSFLLSWSNPPPEDHNGILRQYILNITEENTMTTFEMTLATTQMMLLFLHPYYNYSCAVSAVTVQPGPYSLPIQVTTAEDVPASPPENFQATAASSTSVTITWDPPPAENQNGIITGYFIAVEAMETGERFQLFSESNTLLVEILRPFTTYVCFIAAQTSIGIGPNSTSVTVITPEDVPTASPESLSHTEVLSTSVVLQWNPPPSDQQNGLIRHYIINISELETGQNYSLNTTSQTEQFISGLHPFYTYTFSVSAVTVASGPYSERYTVQTQQDAPSSSPQNLEATAISTRAFLLMWSPPPLEEQNGIISIYLINISVFESGDHFQLASNTTSLVIEGLHPHYTYTCIVAAFTVAMGPFTEVYTIQLPEDVPTAPPQNVDGEVLSSTAIFITWQVPPLEEQNGIIQLYFIHLLEVPTNMNFTYQQDGQHTELVIVSLHPDYDYECSVAAETIVGRGPFSEPFTITTHEDVPAQGPQNVMVTAVDSRSISLRWEPPPPENQNGDIQYYIISVMVTESGEQFRVLSNTTNQTIDDLHPFYTYSILISAVTTDSGPSSPPSIIKTLEDIPAGVPQSFTAVAVSSSRIRLTWAAPIPEEQNGIIQAYHISITELETGEVLRFQTNGTATIMNINSLHPFYTYNCTVAAYTIGLGPSAYTKTQTFSEPPSDVPQNITVIALAATTAQLTWEPPPPEHRNGNIEEYIINITGVDTNEEYELYFKQTFATVSDLHPFYQYKFSIAAATIAVGPFSSLLILQMPETFPGESVQNVTVMVQSPTSVAISWYPPNVQEWNGIVTGYTIQYELLGSVDEYPEDLELQPFLTFTTSIPLPGVPLQNDPDPRTVGLPLQMETAVVNNLQEYFVYQFSIFFGNSIGASDGTVPIIQNMPQAAPSGPPTDVTAAALSSTSLLIIWQPPESFERNGIITAYQIHVTTSGNETLNTYMVSGNTRSLQVEGLQRFTEFIIRISAATSIGTGPISAMVTIRTLEDVPGAPIFSEEEEGVILLNGTTVELNWNPPESPNGVIRDYQVIYVGYILPILSNNNETESGIEIFDGPHALTINGSLSAVIFGLTLGLTYDFKVRARTTVGYGDNSTVITLERLGTTQEQGGGDSTGTTIGLVVFGVFGWIVVIGIVAAVIWYKRRKRIRKRKYTLSQEYGTNSLSMTNPMKRDTADASDDMPAKSEDCEDTHF